MDEACAEATWGRIGRDLEAACDGRVWAAVKHEREAVEGLRHCRQELGPVAHSAINAVACPTRDS